MCLLSDCLPLYFRCRDGKQCVSVSMMCDYYRDCLPLYFRCRDGKQCVSVSMMCDYYPDCQDHSDENCCMFNSPFCIKREQVSKQSPKP